MITCDVLVVGGGPAGSSCARDLVRSGASVVVVDRVRFPRDKCCAGWITPAAVHALDLDLDEYGCGRTLQSITGFRTGVIGAHRAVTTNFARPVSYAIRRCEFDGFLLRRSRARLETGTPVKRIRRDGSRWVVDERYVAPVLIGAGGHLCPVAHLLNPGHEDQVTVVVAQEVEFRMSPDQARRCPVRAEVPELSFCADRQGYGWCVRKGDYLNVGFGRIGHDGFRSRAAEFVAFATAADRLPPGVPDRWGGHAYRLHAEPRRRIVADGVLLAGDAAGLAHPVSGEGILRAIESGRLAARAIMEARGDYRAAALDGYPRAIVRRYGPPTPAPSAAEPRGSRLAMALGSWLMSREWFARRVLLERWFLHVDMPPLAL